MSGFTMEEWIDAAPLDVFHMISDPAKAPLVMHNIVKLEKLTDGPLGVGTRLKETRLVNGKEAETELLIREYEPARRYVVSTEQSGIEVTYNYSMRPERNGTHIHLEAEVQGSGLKKLMLPVVAKIMKREDGDHLRQLKEAIEKLGYNVIKYVPAQGTA